MPENELQESKYGIAETSDMVQFIMSVANLAFKFKTLDMATILTAVTTLAPKAIAAIAGSAKIPQELADLDDAERNQLLALARAEFDIEDDALEELIELALGVAVHILELVQAIAKHKSPAQA